MEIFNVQKAILKYNLLNWENHRNPNYDLSDSKVYFELYLSPEKDICIVGKLDNNHIVWCSLTKLDDRKINAEIFDFVSNYDFKMFSNEYIVLGKEQYDKISDWYRCCIQRATIPGHYWETPFGHYYGNNKADHGNLFSSDIHIYFNVQIEKCNFRLCEGSYPGILRHYLDILMKDTDHSYYYKVEPLISILEAESYLRLCPNAEIRDLYLKCIRACKSLYNRYMSTAR